MAEFIPEFDESGDELKYGVTNPNFTPPVERTVQRGLAHTQPHRRTIDDGVVEDSIQHLEGRVLVGRVDTTRRTLK